MSLIVEDGSGLSTAETLVSVSYCDAHHSNRGNADWAAASTSEKEWAIRKATDYAIRKYRSAWKGYRLKTTQTQDWPRTSVSLADTYLKAWVPIDEIPDLVKQAYAELARKALTLDLNPDQEQRISKETIGPISVTYDAFSSQETSFPAVDGLLSPYLKSGSGINAKLVR